MIVILQRLLMLFKSHNALMYYACRHICCRRAFYTITILTPFNDSPLVCIKGTINY